MGDFYPVRVCNAGSILDELSLLYIVTDDFPAYIANIDIDFNPQDAISKYEEKQDKKDYPLLIDMGDRYTYLAGDISLIRESSLSNIQSYKRILPEESLLESSNTEDTGFILCTGENIMVLDLPFPLVYPEGKVLQGVDASICCILFRNIIVKQFSPMKTKECIFSLGIQEQGGYLYPSISCENHPYRVKASTLPWRKVLTQQGIDYQLRPYIVSI